LALLLARQAARSCCKQVAALEEALADPDDGAGAMEMSRALVDLVLLTPEGRKAAHRPDRRAAAILSIAQSGARRA
jgi:hypothetical protein